MITGSSRLGDASRHGSAAHPVEPRRLTGSEDDRFCIAGVSKQDFARPPSTSMKPDDL